MADRQPGLTTTSYALLALLALRPWTTYELAKQMERSLHWFWPRAESKLYEEPKKLVAHGLASSERVLHGSRPSTVYRITRAGRTALRRWVSQRGAAAPVLEFEALLRVFAGDQVGVAELRSVLDDVRRQMEAWQEFGTALGAEIGTTGGPFPSRMHVNALVHGFLVFYIDAVHRWAEWALDEVADWTDTSPDDTKIARARQTMLAPMQRGIPMRAGYPAAPNSPTRARA